MTSSLTKFEIALDRPNGQFSPGEIVTGRVIVRLDRAKKIRGIRVRSKGSAEVKWQGDGNETTHSKSEQYFRTELYVVGGNRSIEIESGLHAYPFKFSLPRNIPSSFETKHGHVRYTIKATFDRPWRLDHQTTVSFTVVTPFELSQLPTAQVPIEDEKIKNFCCYFPCITMGRMKFYFYMPTSGFAAGENLNAKIDIDNNSTSVDVEMIRLKLEQIIKLYSSWETKKIKHVVQEAIEMRPFDKKAEIIMKMRVPVLPSSKLIFCNIIDICYQIIVKIYFSPCHLTMEKYYPIVIGTRSALSRQSIVTSVPPEVVHNASSFGAPTAPFLKEDTSSVEETIPFPMPMIDLNVNDPVPVVVNLNGKIYPSPISRISDTQMEYPPSMGAPAIGFVIPNLTESTSESMEEPPLS